MTPTAQTAHPVVGMFFIFAALLAILQFVARISFAQYSRRDRYLLLTLATLAYILYFAGTAITPGVFPQPGFLHWHLPVLFLLGPAIRYFLKFSLLPDEEIPLPTILLQYSPALLCLIFIASPLYPQRDVTVAELMSTFATRATNSHDVLAIFAFIVNTGYYLLNLYETRFLFRLNVAEFRGVFRYVAMFQVGSVITPLLALFALLLHEILWLEISCALISLTIVLGYIASVRYPAFFRPLQIEAEKQKYAVSHLRHVDLRSLANKLDLLVHEEKVYLNDRLSLKALAGMLNVTPHQLSEYLNVHLGKSFAAFLNEYRIAEAKRLLAEKTEMNILEIAFASGFGTKSNFNSLFLRATGLSPMQYRRQQQK